MFEKDISVTLRKTQQKLNDLNRQKIAEANLSFRLFHILVLIKEHDEWNQKDLAKAMKLTQGAISGSIKRLLNLEMITQVPLEEDNRYNRLVVTEKGLQVIEDFEADVNHRYVEIFDGFSETDLMTFNAYLNQLNSNLETIENKKKEGVIF